MNVQSYIISCVIQQQHDATCLWGKRRCIETKCLSPGSSQTPLIPTQNLHSHRCPRYFRLKSREPCKVKSPPFSLSLSLSLSVNQTYIDPRRKSFADSTHDGISRAMLVMKSPTPVLDPPDFLCPSGSLCDPAFGHSKHVLCCLLLIENVHQSQSELHADVWLRSHLSISLTNETVITGR